MKELQLHYPTLNFLRGIAALMVCLFHFLHFKTPHQTVLLENGFWWNISESGALGVFIFFVISGFVIPLSLYKYNFQIGQTGHFLARRAIRIELPYLGSIALIIGIQILFTLYTKKEADWTILQIIEHIFYLIPFTTDQWLNPIYWTLAIEFQFYILIVLLFSLLKGRNQNIQCFILALFLITFFIFPDTRFASAYAPFFLIGICLYLHKTDQLTFERLLLYLSVLLAIVLFKYGTIEGVFVMVTIACIQFVEIQKSYTEWFGKISYSLYLVHGATGGTFLYFILEKSTSSMEVLLCMVTALVLSILSAWLYWRFIENPAIRIAKKIKL